MPWRTRKRGSSKQRGTKFKSTRKLPKSPEKGERFTIRRRGRKITFEATGKEGFGKWKIVSNEPA